jgi:WhiB family redox-sensing transcriptional regulator
VGKSNFTDAELTAHARMRLALIDKIDQLDEAGTPVVCKQDPDLFFPEGQGAIVYQTLKEAKAICMPCPLRDACLTYALVADMYEGVWGGTTPLERKAIRKELKANGEFDTIAKVGYLAYRKSRLQASTGHG